MVRVGTHSSSKSRNSSGKKVPKGRGSPSLNAIKSLPAEYRLMQVLHTINLTTQQFLTVDAENSILRAQMNELTQRLESLHEMVNHMNALGGPAWVEAEALGILGNDMGDMEIFNGYEGDITHNLVCMNEPWNVGSYGYLNQPFITSADVLQY